MRRPDLRHLLPLALALVLAACASSDEDELRQWMVQERAAVKPKVEPIAPPKEFEPRAFDLVDAVSPFSADKLVAALGDGGGDVAVNALLAPELNRRKEPLELMPLDVMKMVGLLDKDGDKVGLLQVDKLLYRVKVGNYLGQNFGLIKDITNEAIVLREIVQDASGEWVERQAELQLVEGSK